MAKKEKINFQELSENELRERLFSTRDKLFHMRLQNNTAPLKNPHAIQYARRDIARIMTVLKQKGIKV
ncbi:MAG TPA: 50S ribosomal protein L29 [Elusimicrobiota bacterium]|nr:50S ribosomal protein L29 [Elusimicrobiota bacterium]